MNKIEEKFKSLKDEGRSALVCYVTAGDPTIGLTKDIVFELENSGADIIELGIPFSDPMADGPTIQLASERSLANGTTLPDVLDIIKEVRKSSDIPIVLFGYYNPFLKYGLEKIAKDARSVGADGILVVDLPPEESKEFKKHTDENGLSLIFLLAPTSTESRIKLVSENASGFIYLVSITGVTGSRPDMEFQLSTLTNDIKELSNLPVGVGFGVSSAEHAKEISSFADAVIVGSALVKIIQENDSNKKVLLNKINTFINELSEACVRA